VKHTQSASPRSPRVGVGSPRSERTAAPGSVRRLSKDTSPRSVAASVAASGMSRHSEVSLKAQFAQLEAREKELAAKEKAAATSKESWGALMRDLEDANRRVAEARSEAEQQRKLARKLANSQQEREQQLRSLEKDAGALRSKVRALESDLEERRKEAERARDRARDAETKAKSLSVKLAAAEAARDEQAKLAEAAALRAGNLRASLDEAKRDNSAAIRKSVSKTDVMEPAVSGGAVETLTLATTTVEEDPPKESPRAAINAAKAEASAALVRLKAAQAAAEAAEAERAEADAARDAAETAAHEAKQAQKAAKDSLEDVSRRLDETEGMLAELQEELKSAIAEADKFKDEAFAAIDRQAEIQSQLDERTAQLEDAEADLQQLREEAASAQGSLAEASAAYKQELEHLRKQLEVMTHKVQEMKGSASNDEEMAAMRAEAAKHKEALDATLEELHGLRTREQEALHKVSKLESQLSASTSLERPETARRRKLRLELEEAHAARQAAESEASLARREAAELRIRVIEAEGAVGRGSVSLDSVGTLPMASSLDDDGKHSEFSQASVPSEEALHAVQMALVESRRLLKLSQGEVERWKGQAQKAKRAYQTIRDEAKARLQTARDRLNDAQQAAKRAEEDASFYEEQLRMAAADVVKWRKQARELRDDANLRVEKMQFETEAATIEANAALDEAVDRANRAESALEQVRVEHERAKERFFKAKHIADEATKKLQVASKVMRRLKTENQAWKRAAMEAGVSAPAIVETTPSAAVEEEQGVSVTPGAARWLEQGPSQRQGGGLGPRVKSSVQADVSATRLANQQGKEISSLKAALAAARRELASFRSGSSPSPRETPRSNRSSSREMKHTPSPSLLRGSGMKGVSRIPRPTGDSVSPRRNPLRPSLTADSAGKSRNISVRGGTGGLGSRYRQSPTMSPSPVRGSGYSSAAVPPSRIPARVSPHRSRPDLPRDVEASPPLDRLARFSQEHSAEPTHPPPTKPRRARPRAVVGKSPLDGLITPSS
jgi:hypothetical protein